MNSPYNILQNPKLLNIQQALVGVAGLKIAIIFGSMAKGSSTANSDLDIAIMLQKPLTAQNKMQLIETLTQVVERPIDLIDLHTVGEPLLGQILKHGILMMGERSQLGYLTSKHLFNLADFVPYQHRIYQQRQQTLKQRIKQER